MRAVTDYWRSEPAMIVSLAAALIAAFAIPVAWAKVVMSAVSIIGGVVTRSQVYAPDTIEGNPVANAAVNAAEKIEEYNEGEA